MQMPARWYVFVCLSLAMTTTGQAQKPSAGDDIAHMREELGINEFTAPSIGLVFEELQSLKPIPFDKVWRNLPDATPQDRTQLAIAAGGVIADGFLAVSAEKQSRIEPVGRALLRLAKGLGVGEHITKHSRSIMEKAAKDRWSDVKTELVRAQADVEAAMLGLKDEEIAHLVALGGWLRGLEITSGIVIENYSPDKARRLVQPELMDYFLARVETLNPNIKKTTLGHALDKNLKEMKRIITKPVDTPVALGEVKQIRDLSRELNKMALGINE